MGAVEGDANCWCCWCRRRAVLMLCREKRREENSRRSSDEKQSGGREEVNKKEGRPRQRSRTQVAKTRMTGLMTESRNAACSKFQVASSSSSSLERTELLLHAWPTLRHHPTPSRMVRTARGEAVTRRLTVDMMVGAGPCIDQTSPSQVLWLLLTAHARPRPSIKRRQTVCTDCPLCAFQHPTCGCSRIHHGPHTAVDVIHDLPLNGKHSATHD